MTCLPPNLHSFEVSSHSHQNGSDIQLWVSNGFELELLKKLSCGTYYRHRCFLFESSWVTIWHQFRVYSTVIQLYVSFFRFFSLMGFYKISSIISCARLLNWSFSSHFSSVQVPLCCVLSRVHLVETASTVACQAPLSLGILQSRILDWVAMPSFRGSSQPRDQTQVSRIAGWFFTIWATREAQEYWSG